MTSDISMMLSKNVILVDTSYIDKVALDFSNNFEQVLARPIHKADLPLWLDCLSLDGGIEPGNNDIQVIFIYQSEEMKSFTPSKMKEEIDGKAFKDNIGEFTLEAYEVASCVTTIGNQFSETLQILSDAKNVERILVVPNMEEYGNEVIKVLEKKNCKNQIELFSILPQEGKGFNYQQLGFSVVHALGISSQELQCK